MNDPEQLEYTSRVEVPVENPAQVGNRPQTVQAPTDPADGWFTQETSRTAASHGETMYVPLAVTVGDGFKFGCGFFMAFVLALLVGFVLLSALFALSSLLGLNLPVSPSAP